MKQSTKNDKEAKEFVLNVCVAELNNHIDKQLKYENIATEKFREMLSSTTAEQTQNIYNGMQTSREAYIESLEDMSDEIMGNMDINVFNALNDVSQKTNDIYNTRIKIVEDRMKDLGIYKNRLTRLTESFSNIYMQQNPPEYMQYENGRETEVDNIKKKGNER